MGFLPRYPKVAIHWNDASTRDAWHEEDAERPMPEVVTVGYLMRRTRRAYEVAASLCDNGDAAGVWVIPRGMVTRVERLR